VSCKYIKKEEYDRLLQKVAEMKQDMENIAVKLTAVCKVLEKYNAR